MPYVYIKYGLAGMESLTAVSYFALVYRLVRRGQATWMPAFSLYCAVMVVDMVWCPTTMKSVVWVQPLLLTLRSAVVIEAFGLVTDRTCTGFMRSILLTMLFAGAAVTTRAVGFYDMEGIRDLQGWYRVGTQTVHVCLAAACLAGNAYQLLFRREVKWTALWIPHFRLVGVYMGMRAVLSFFMALPKGHWREYVAVRVLFLTGVCAWTVVWFWYDRRELRAARFKSTNSRLEGVRPASFPD